MLGIETVKKLIKNALDKLERRVRGMVRRGIIRSWDNSKSTGGGQFEMTKDELVDSVESIQLPGISWRPLPDCEAIVFAVGGNPSNLIGIPSQRDQRLKDEELDPGEVALYINNTDQVIRLKRNHDVLLQSGTNGHIVTLKANGDIILDSQGGKIYLGANGATKAVALAEDVDNNFDTLKIQLNNHKHFAGFALLDGMGLPCTGLTSGPDGPFTGIVATNSDTVFCVS